MYWKKPRSIAGVIFVLFLFSLLVVGCSKKPREPESVLDTPEHHAYNGFKLLGKNRIDDAQREFELAIQLEKRFSPAHRGMGLVYGERGDFKLAFKSMRFAKKCSKTKDEKALAYVGFMRLYTKLKNEDWLEEVEDSFDDAIDLNKDLPDAYYYMGIAYKEAHQFSDSENALKMVLEINEDLISEANEELKTVQKIIRAMPGSDVGKKIAVLKRITRADVAALFIQELKLDTVYEKFRPKKQDVSFKPPGKASDEKVSALPTDVEDHTLRVDVESVLELDIKGLETFPDGTFEPDKNITRASYAMMIADIIATIKLDQSLSSRYIGTKSPFSDVREDVPYFNAIMLCTTWGGIMEGKDGMFNPMGGVSGADALLIIRKVREELKIF